MPNEEYAKKREDAHFHEADRKLIEKLRAKADKERSEQEKAHRKQTHWMKCPKCGHDLKETERGNVVVDLCAECGGMFLDSGELDILLAASQGSLLGRWFGKKK
jgi:ribosomal protein L37AE/L43A